MFSETLLVMDANRSPRLAVVGPLTARAEVAREAALIACAILVYFGVRNVTAGSVDAAFANAGRLVRLEHSLGLAWEGSLQAALLGMHGVLTVANWVYIWGHWPVIIGAAAALYVYRRDRYYLLRNAFFISGAIGFLLFALFPVAPPRLLDLGLIDTVTQQSHAYRALQPPGLTNQYAAFPSLHAGWNLLVGVVLFGSTSRLVVRLFALLSPAAMFLAVLVTANHFVVDIAGGVAIVLVALAAARAVERRRRRTLVESEPEPVHPRRRDAVRRRAPRRQPPRHAARGRSGRSPARRG
jgi:hypothetical protein